MSVSGTALLSCDTGVVYSTSCLLIVQVVLQICFAYTKQVLPFKMQQWVQLWHWLLDFEGGHQNTHLYQYLISLCCE